MRDIKLEVMFYTYNQSMAKVISKHYTTVNKLCDGDRFFKQDLEVICKRQFTGLKDKNGVEIYEGDIVKSLHFIGQDDTSHYLHFEVKWSKKFMGWVAIRSDGTEMQLWVCMNSTNGCLHVAGNIYENPELLQETK